MGSSFPGPKGSRDLRSFKKSRVRSEKSATSRSAWGLK